MGCRRHRLVRSAAQLVRARAAVKESGIAFKILDEHVETTHGCILIGTMHLAKGLEFRAVVVMACDDEIIPLQERIETVGDDADLQEVYDTERTCFTSLARAVTTNFNLSSRVISVSKNHHLSSTKAIDNPSFQDRQLSASPFAALRSLRIADNSVAVRSSEKSHEAVSNKDIVSSLLFPFCVTTHPTPTTRVLVHLTVPISRRQLGHSRHSFQHRLDLSQAIQERIPSNQQAFDIRAGRVP
jgi:hypothetical protein